MVSYPLSVWLLALTAPVLWGTTYSVTQHWLGAADPLWLAALRILIPALLMLPLVPLSVWRRHSAVIALLSTLNVGVFTVLLFEAIQRLPGGMAATLVSSMPLQLLLIRALQGRFPSWLQLLTAITGMSGVGLLVWQAPAEPDWAGVVMALAAATCVALGVILTARLNPGLKPLTLTAAQLIVSAPLLLLAALLSGQPFPAIDGGGLLALLWISPVGMGLGYYAWFRSIGSMDISKLAYLTLINPLVAVLAGVLFMQEHLSTGQWLAIMLVLGSVLLAQHPRARGADRQ